MLQEERCVYEPKVALAVARLCQESKRDAALNR